MKRAFSIIEALVSISILALVGGGMVGLIAAIAGQQTKTSEMVLTSSAVQSSMAVYEVRDFTASVPPTYSGWVFTKLTPKAAETTNDTVVQVAAFFSNGVLQEYAAGGYPKRYLSANQESKPQPLSMVLVDQTGSQVDLGLEMGDALFSSTGRLFTVVTPTQTGVFLDREIVLQDIVHPMVVFRGATVIKVK